MGTLRSTFNHTGLVVNGCLLGEPAFTDPNYYWDHHALPNGEIAEDGTISLDQTESE